MEEEGLIAHPTGCGGLTREDDAGRAVGPEGWACAIAPADQPHLKAAVPETLKNADAGRGLAGTANQRVADGDDRNGEGRGLKLCPQSVLPGPAPEKAQGG